MREHIGADEPFERSELPAADAIDRFRSEEQPYKVELIEDLVSGQGVEKVSLYRNGPFTDLCRGPHAPSTGRIKAFKLNSIAGAYWRGDETRQMLTRIYGTAFHSQADLDRHLEQLELARKHDHRRLGPELGLFRFREEAPGMPFWLPNGTVLLRLIEAEVREQLQKRGYVEIKTPVVLDEEATGRTTRRTCTSSSPASAGTR
jgi:threonyl-tRNA synthetase